MTEALVQAARGVGKTSPNPPVGAVVVSEGTVIGHGYHRRAGGPHAEVYALKAAGQRSRGATLYITLEPCCHLDKRTPPCVPAIIASGIRRVVIATRDPNPKVRGKGIASLQKAGIRVEHGVCRSQADALIESYRTWVTTGRPLVTLKLAQTLDGKIATATGESKWITGEEARRRVHQLRAASDAILVGIGTVLADDPQLTIRVESMRRQPPLRIVLDPHLRTPRRARLMADRAAPTLIVTMPDASQVQRRQFAGAVEVLSLPHSSGHAEWKPLLEELGRRGITSLLIEGGSEVSASALRSGTVQRVVIFIAPKLLGGKDAVSAIGGRSPKRLSGALSLRDVDVTRIGADLMIQGRLE